MANSPIVANTIADLRAELKNSRLNGRRIGVVPTMGALHEGHLSLMRTARSRCETLVSTIFVNPTQFAPGDDFEKYPRPRERDLELCGSEGVDLVFTPNPEAMYLPGHQTHVEVETISRPWEGAYRPAHFRGVTTVVIKLFNIVQADIAFFGQKDYQQQLLIRQMCRDLNVPTQIHTCATIREEDGLALSSRNAYLSPSERSQAIKLSASLQLGLDRIADGETNLIELREAMNGHLVEGTEFIPDYLTIVDAETLEELSEPAEKMVAIGAATLGSTRLIDNMLIPPFRLDQINPTM